jgi:hypothetical protein
MSNENREQITQLWARVRFLEGAVTALKDRLDKLADTPDTGRHARKEETP